MMTIGYMVVHSEQIFNAGEIAIKPKGLPSILYESIAPETWCLFVVTAFHKSQQGSVRTLTVAAATL